MKHALSVMLSIVMLLSFAACGASDNGTADADAVSSALEYMPEEPSSLRFVRIAEGERVRPPHALSNTHEDGGFMVMASYVDGTPYYFADIIYDPDLMTKSRYTRRKPGDNAPGSGWTEMNWLFTPLAPGETEVLLLTRNLSTDETKGRAFHITIDDNLRCTLAWYEDGMVGVNYLLYDANEGFPEGYAP